MHKSLFQMLEASVTLAGPQESVEPIEAAYRRFRIEPGEDVEPVAVRLEPVDGGFIVHVGDRAETVPAGVDPTLMLYQSFLFALMDQVASRIVLHSAALVHPDGGAILIAGPSGFGKTSLTLELCNRGFRFLSDDYAPLCPERGTIAPHPRAVGILPRGEAPIPESFRAQAGKADVPKLFGKSLVDVCDVLGEDSIAGEEAELKQIFLLGSEDESPLTTVEFGARLEEAAVVEAGMDIPGVELVETSDRGDVRIWRVEVDPRRNPTPRLSALLESEPILFTEKHWDGRQRFLDKPRGGSIEVTEAARRLSREILNRRKRGALIKRMGGLPRLFVELAGGIAAANCHRLQPGPFRATADWIEEHSSSGCRGRER